MQVSVCYPDYFWFLLRGMSTDFCDFRNRSILKRQSSSGSGGGSLVMCDHDDGPSFAVTPVECCQDNFATYGIEISGGFVGQNDLRIVDQCSRQCDSLLLADAQL